jgi:hypothetical protein
MVNKAQTGMQGVYLVAAELTGRGFTVSVTSRNAFGADLLVTDPKCEQTWSVQVKTNHEPMGFWLVNKHTKDMKSPSHVYVFVNLSGNNRPEYYVVKSKFVADHICVDERPNSTFYSFARNDAKPYSDEWDEVFGNPGDLPKPKRSLPARLQAE